MLLLHASLDAPWLCKTAEAKNLSLMSVFSKHKGEIGEKNHVGFSGSIESQFSIWPASKTQSVITAEEKTTQSTTKVLENTLIKN